MWPRIGEILLGIWLLAGPFVFATPPDANAERATTLGGGTLTILLALLCWWPPAEKAHLATLAVAAWLIGFGYFSGGGPAAPSPSGQSMLTVGLLLAMFAILPSRAAEPPRAWREFLEKTPNRKQERDAEVGGASR
jgi:hypothetical protein